MGAHGGSSNAYTGADHTNYFFDIQPDYFHEGLDRFAQFFISPLFDSAYVDREKHAVHSEYQLQIKDDGWRAFSAQKSALNPAHPGSRFSIGTLETLGEGVNDALLDFFAKNYSANQMVMVTVPSPLGSGGAVMPVSSVLSQPTSASSNSAGILFNVVSFSSVARNRAVYRGRGSF